MWHLDGDGSHLVAERQLPGAIIASLPAVGVVAVVDGRVRYLDPGTLAEFPVPASRRSPPRPGG